MGMYDTVYCDQKLPTSILHTKGFQTKDLECELHTYYIKEDGTIWRNLAHIAVSGNLPLQQEFVGDKTIRIYDYLPERRNGASMWIEYEVVIKNSIVDKIKLTKFEKCK